MYATPPSSCADRAQSALDVARVDVLQDVGADDEVDVARQSHRAEFAEAAAANVARLAVALERVLARLDADVAHVASHAPEHREPRRFAAADVEHGANATPEMIFGDRTREANLSLEAVSRRDAVGGMAIPAVEVFAIV